MISRRIIIRNDENSDRKTEAILHPDSNNADSSNEVNEHKYEDSFFKDSPIDDAASSSQFQDTLSDRNRRNGSSIHRSKKSLSGYRRTKRGTGGSPIFVETAVFVDRDLYHHMAQNYPDNTERELIRFVLAMINAVSIYIYTVQ